MIYQDNGFRFINPSGGYTISKRLYVIKSLCALFFMSLHSGFRCQFYVFCVSVGSLGNLTMKQSSFFSPLRNNKVINHLHNMLSI